jgi:hypothetical protein
MNTIRNAGLILCVTGSALVAPASAESGQAMEHCKSQVQGYYGEAADMRLVSKRQYVDGTRMKVAVRSHDPESGYTRSRFATCWVASENPRAGWARVTDTDQVEETMIAATEPVIAESAAQDF